MHVLHLLKTRSSPDIIRSEPFERPSALGVSLSCPVPVLKIIAWRILHGSAANSAVFLSSPCYDSLCDEGLLELSFRSTMATAQVINSHFLTLCLLDLLLRLHLTATRERQRQARQSNTKCNTTSTTRNLSQRYILQLLLA